MPFDGKALDVVATTDRARFAADLAKHANEPYGQALATRRCALARFFGGAQVPHSGHMNFHQGDVNWWGVKSWQHAFITKYDRQPRQPTGFDCLCILNSIP